MPEPLMTQTLINAVGPKALASTVVFGFPNLSEEFIDRLKAAGLYRSPISIQSAAITFLHVKQLVNALIKCPKDDIDCEVGSSSQTEADPVLEFKGWHDRIAVYEYLLRKWQDGKFNSIE